MVESAGGSKEAFQMLMLEHVDHLADASAKAISNLKFDKIVVWDSGNNANGSSSTANFIKGIATALPPVCYTCFLQFSFPLFQFFLTLIPQHLDYAHDERHRRC